MYEDLSPSSKSCGLYDELADDLAKFLKEINVLRENGTVLALATGLVEAIVIALRHDNANFNEARFRKRISNALYGTKH
jgi:hypothetical protein